MCVAMLNHVPFLHVNLNFDVCFCFLPPSVQHIDSLILSISFSGIKIKTINSIESWNEGVLVVVSGSVKPKDSCRWRNFVQTFFLAPQEKGYFVLNDVFHFGDEEVNDQPQPLEVPENNFDALQTAPSLPTGSFYHLQLKHHHYLLLTSPGVSPLPYSYENLM